MINSLRSHTDGIQSLRMKDVPSENVNTVISYLKRAFLLPLSYGYIPSDTMGLLNDVMSSADCFEFTGYVKTIYFALKRAK